MKFNYFNERDSKIGFAKLSRALTYSFARAFPSVTAQVGKRIFLKPTGKRHYQFDQIRPDKEINLQTSLGNVHVNLFGQGKSVIVVSHGWADSSICFQGIIKSLVEQGYLVAAVDNIGHGKSFGNKSHLLGFIESLEQVLEHMEQERLSVAGIVGHSMGALATLNLSEQHLKNCKVVLIALPVNFFDLMFTKVEKVGISKQVLINIVDSIAQTYGKVWHQLDSFQHKHKVSKNFTFIHDIEDRFAPIKDLEHYLNDGDHMVVKTEGLGHRRILGDTYVIEEISRALMSK